MNKFSAYFFLFIIILIGLNLVGTCNYNRKTKDNFIIEEDSCVYRTNNTINAFTIEEVDSDNLVQDIWSPIVYGCTD